MEKKQTKNNAFWITVFGMLALVVLGRGVSWVTTVASTDIAYAAWVSSVLSYLGELLVSARTVVAVAGITYAVYQEGKRGTGKFLTAAAVASLIDYAARFVIDFATNAIVGAEVLAVSWLFLQFIFEMLFVALSYLVAGAMKRKFAAAEVRRKAEKYTVNRACTVSVLLMMLSRIAFELWYFIDFVTTYSNITSTETASIVGSFLRIIVIYGGAAALLGEWYTDFLKKQGSAPRDVKRD